jgi:acid-sensing ion channel, other
MFLIHRKINPNIFRFTDNDYSFILSFKMKTPSNIFVNSLEETVVARQHMKIPPLKPGEIYSVVSMQETISDATIRKLRLKQRKCLFKNEAKFKYHKNEEYSHSTCMKECRIDRAMKICGCLPPVYLTEAMENLTKCDFESLKCLKDQKIVDDRECKCLLPCEFTAVEIESINRRSFGSANSTTDYSIALKNFPLVS